MLSKYLPPVRFEFIGCGNAEMNRSDWAVVQYSLNSIGHVVRVFNYDPHHITSQPKSLTENCEVFHLCVSGVSGCYEKHCNILLWSLAHTVAMSYR